MRVCFEAEKAHWHYLDLIRLENEALPLLKFAAERGSFRVAYSEDMGSAVVATLATGAPSFDQAL